MREWEEWENDYLRANWKQKPAREIGDHLQRTKNSIIGRAHRICSGYKIPSYEREARRMQVWRRNGCRMTPRWKPPPKPKPVVIAGSPETNAAQALLAYCADAERRRDQYRNGRRL